jgi:elongation factor Ts
MKTKEGLHKMTITASQVKELRERTGVGMMECKKALEAIEATGATGDDIINKAIEELRKSGLAKAAKKAGRIAAEGVILIAQENQKAALVEVNSETDFAGRDESFLEFANKVSNIALAQSSDDLDILLSAKMGDLTVEEARLQLITKIGENINVRRFTVMDSNHTIGTYVHNRRIGVIVEVEQGNAELARDIAMHIAASKPEVVNPEDLPAEKLAQEKEIFKAQAAESGKPANIIEKMVEGRVAKYLEEVSLVHQAFIKDPDVKISALLKQHNAKVLRFIRYELGEGIEKQEVDFRAEVMAQVKNAG